MLIRNFTLIRRSASARVFHGKSALPKREFLLPFEL